MMIPNLIAGYLYGPWAGMLAGLLHLGWFGLVVRLGGGDAVAVLLQSMHGTLVVLLSGPLAGWVSRQRVQVHTILQERERRLQFLAEHDPLTGLWTRSHFQAQLEERLRAEEKGALIFIDLDGFQYVNDSLGHQVGDDLLHHIAGRLRELYGDQASLARLGGDEFAVYLPGADGTTACAQSAELSDALRNCPMMVGGQAVSVGASAGVAVYPDHGSNPPELLRKAYVAVYRAKENGRSRVQLFCPTEAPRGTFADKVALEELIRESLEYDRFVLHSQPILDLATEQVSHHELLIRMQRPDGSLIFPDQFISVAEQFGLIRLIDRWVAIAAMRMAGAMVNHRFSVNLSARAPSDDELVPLIKRELASSRVDPTRLVFELTETAAISDLERAAQFVAAIRELGCGFALDDFGAGFTSFTTLRRLPVTHLKIDGSLIRDLSRDPINQRLVIAICEMAQALEMKTVAEFVEDEETVRCLRAFGADYAQGYYIGKPGPLS